MSEGGVNFVAPDSPEGDVKNNVPRNLMDLHSIGAILTRAREGNDWSVQQVADQLKLSPKQIAALEANEFDALPKMVIVRGFVRTYAKLLKIDADSLVGMLPRETDDLSLKSALRPALSTPFLESRLSLAGHQESNKKYFFGAVLFAVFAAIFFLAKKTELIPTIKDLLGVDASVTHLDEIGASAVDLPIAHTDSKVQEVSASIAVASSASVGVESVAASGVVDQKDQLAQVAASVVNSPAVLDTKGASVASINAQLTPAPIASVDVKNTLKFKFRQDSWIQVKKENGVILTSHLAKAGTEEFFNVNEPLQVRIGNAAGVDGVLRGSVMMIAADKGSNVANLNVK